MSEPRAAHWPTLIFEDGDGDLVRCECGEQGFDFKQGREWFAAHVRAVLASEGGPTLIRENSGGDWWTDGAMVCEGQPGDEGFVGDAASPEDAQEIVGRHNARLSEAASEGGLDVERLAAAIINVADRQGDRDFDVTEALARAEQLAPILAEYARLAAPFEEPTDAE